MLTDTVQKRRPTALLLDPHKRRYILVYPEWQVTKPDIYSRATLQFVYHCKSTIILGCWHFNSFSTWACAYENKTNVLDVFVIAENRNFVILELTQETDSVSRTDSVQSLKKQMQQFPSLLQWTTRRHVSNMTTVDFTFGGPECVPLTIGSLRPSLNRAEPSRPVSLWQARA